MNITVLEPLFGSITRTHDSGKYEGWMAETGDTAIGGDVVETCNPTNHQFPVLCRVTTGLRIWGKPGVSPKYSYGPHAF